MRAKLSFYVTTIALIAILTIGVGCTKAPNDAQLTSDIQNKLVADSGLQGKQLGVKAEDGTVTLTGTVDNDGQREAAARYAASEPGVKQVINNLQVAAPPPVEAAQTAPPVEEAKPSPLFVFLQCKQFSGTDDSHDRTSGTGTAATAASAAEGHDSFGHDPGCAPGRHH
jgi:BON domain